MVFVSEYTIAAGSRNAAQARFKETGGQPPKGVKMIARWHSAGGCRGVTICEADDVQSIAAWFQGWTDVVNFDIYPAIDDAGVAKLLA